MTIDFQFKLQRKSFELDVSAQLPNRGISVLFGRSGSGKTTLLRCIAGLESADSGKLSVNGHTWLDSEKQINLPVHERPLGYVFQEASLFPHLSVEQNLNYGRKRTQSVKDPNRLSRLIELLDIGHLIKRKPHTLSGGERQRVAIARAMAVCPEVLLMDEPLAALDANRKTEILSFLSKLNHDMDIPIIYITHSPREVTQLADYLVFLEEGKVTLDGPLDTALTHPDSPLSKGNRASTILPVTVDRHDLEYDLTEMRFSGGTLIVPRQSLNIGEQLRVRIYARDITLSLRPPTDSTIQNVIPAAIECISDVPDGLNEVRLKVGDATLLAHVTRRSVESLSLSKGQQVYAQFKATAVL